MLWTGILLVKNHNLILRLDLFCPTFFRVSNRALHTELELEYWSRDLSRNKFFAKYKFDFDAINSVYTEYSEYRIFRSKTPVFGSKTGFFNTLNITYLFCILYLYNFDAINFVFLENTD